MGGDGGALGRRSGDGETGVGGDGGALGRRSGDGETGVGGDGGALGGGQETERLGWEGLVGPWGGGQETERLEWEGLVVHLFPPLHPLFFFPSLFSSSPSPPLPSLSFTSFFPFLSSPLSYPSSLPPLSLSLQTRTHYLELLCRIVTNTDYKEHRHRRQDISTCLNRIAQEENPESERDHEVIKKLWVTFPGIFEEVTDL